MVHLGFAYKLHVNKKVLICHEYTYSSTCSYFPTHTLVMEITQKSKVKYFSNSTGRSSGSEAMTRHKRYTLLAYQQCLE